MKSPVFFYALLTHMAAAGIYTRGNPKSMFFAIPAGAEWKDFSIFTGFRHGDGKVLFDGEEIVSEGVCRRAPLIHAAENPFPAAGETHSIEIVVRPGTTGCPAFGIFVGTVLVYKFP